MIELDKVSLVADSLKHLLNDADTFALSYEWCHSTSLVFLSEMRRILGGQIKDCQPEGVGYYLNF